MKITNLLLIFTVTVLTFSKSTWAAQEPTIAFNYKNLNTIGSMICEVTALSSRLKKDIALVHNIKINKQKLGQGKLDAIFEISGTCNSKFSISSKKLVSLGDEIDMTVDLKSLNNTTGTVGINEIRLKFKNRKLQAITNIDPLGLSNGNKRTQVIAKKWAQTNSAFSFEKKSGINIKYGKSKVKEVASNLYVFNNNSRSKWSNIWHYQTKVNHKRSNTRPTTGG